MTRRPTLIPGPDVDYASAGAARAQAYGSLSEALDRMSGFAFKEAAERAKIAGAQYGFDKPITVEQIQDAIAQDRDIDEIVGDPTTIFGAASRATIGQKLQAQLEGEARSQMAVINGAVAAGQPVDIDSLKTTINGVMDGHSSVLAEIDPRLASQYRATISTVAASTFKLATQEVFKARQRELVKDYDTSKSSLVNVLGAAYSIAGENDFNVTAAAINRSHLDAALTTGDKDIAGRAQSDFEAADSAAATGALVGYALKSLSSTDERGGGFGELSWIWKKLSTAEQEDVIRRVRTIRDNRHTDEQRQEAEQDERDKEEANSVAATLSVMDPSDPRRQTLLPRLEHFKSLGLYPPSVYEGARDGRVTPSNKDHFYEVEQLILRGEITKRSELDASFTAMNINVQDQNALYDKLRTVTSDIYRQAVDVVTPLVRARGDIPEQQKPLAIANAAIQLTQQARIQGESPYALRETVSVGAEIQGAKDDMRRAFAFLSQNVEGWNDQGIDFTADVVLSFDSVESLLTKINQIKNSKFYNELRDKSSLDRALSSVVESYKRLAPYGIGGLD
jgi:hypothetical protein